MNATCTPLPIQKGNQMNVAQVVDNGFNALSREQRDRVNLETLDMFSTYACIIGQVFPDEFFHSGIRVLSGLAWEGADEWAYEHGFDISGDEFDFDWHQLQAEWIRRLSEERQSIWDAWMEENQSER